MYHPCARVLPRTKTGREKALHLPRTLYYLPEPHIYTRRNEIVEDAGLQVEQKKVFARCSNTTEDTCAVWQPLRESREFKKLRICRLLKQLSDESRLAIR